ncbi:not available [Yersinia enterocolitica]|nr:not available [Yersinia enterocolitica]
MAGSDLIFISNLGEDPIRLLGIGALFRLIMV